ncbi:MAG: flagellar export chaperone FliS [Acidobacteriota bacterium]|nr:flagellar export chaperone FliS [Acidobacteriota bacterium]
MLAHSVQAQTAYLQVKTQATSPEETLVLLFDGMVRILRLARAAMDARRLEEQSAHIGRVQRILTELTCALHEPADPALVSALRATYNHMYNRLVEANVRDDLAALDEVTELADNLGQAWRTALKNLSGAEREAIVAAG